MVRIIKTEFYKLKRYHILWAGVALMLLSVLLTLFTSMANDGSVWDFAYLTEQVIKNNMSMIFPMCISLIAGYMISREQTDDTLKNILTVPVSFKRLLTGKLIVCGVLFSGQQFLKRDRHSQNIFQCVIRLLTRNHISSN